MAGVGLWAGLLLGAAPDTGGRGPEPPPVPTPVDARMLLDLEILRDLDLLRELDALRRLGSLERPSGPSDTPEKKAP